MDFLLECIGFPPDADVAKIAQLVCGEGEPAAWRGPEGVHLRLPLGEGVEIRLDREEGQDHWTLWPHYEVPRRLRVAVESIARLSDSPFDALLRGTANPPLPTGPAGPAGEPAGDADPPYRIATFVSDARRLPDELPPGHVLAVSIAGFAIDVESVGLDGGVRAPRREVSEGVALDPLAADADHPGGCMDASLPIERVRRLRNPLTGEPFSLLEVRAPGRPLDVFVSPWQLASEGLADPEPGQRIEGVFVFTGRVSGGLPSTARRAPTRFG